MENLVASAGNYVNAVGKVVTDTAEKLVQDSEIGHLSEAMGFKIEKDIYHNGLNTETTGTAAEIISRGKADKITTTLKVETKDGDFGA